MNDFFEDNKNFYPEVKKKSLVYVIDDEVNNKGLYSELLDRIRAGITKSLICDWLINQGLNYTKPQLNNYINFVIKRIGLLNLSGYDKLKSSIVKKIDNSVDELIKLQELYEIQRERINIDFETEKKIKKLFKTTGYEIYLASKILSEMIKIKMELGILDRKKLSEFEGANINVLNIDGRQVVISEDTKKKVLSVLNEIKKLGVNTMENKDKIIDVINEKIESLESQDMDSSDESKE